MHVGDVSHLKQHWPEGLFLHQALATGGNVILLYIIIWRQKSCLLYTETINILKKVKNVVTERHSCPFLQSHLLKKKKKATSVHN